MKSLYLRIYATVVAVLLLFAFASGFVVERHIDNERQRNESVANERLEAWGDLIQRSLPGTDAPAEVQAAALREWSQRLRFPLALDDPEGRRLGASDTFTRRMEEGLIKPYAVKLDDGRTLWAFRPGQLRQLANSVRRGGPDGRPPPPWPPLPDSLPRGTGLAIVLVVLFIAIAAGAYPVVRRLTRRLEALKQGVEQFGAGQLSHRVEVNGSDEVAAVASSFNVAAQRVEALVQSHKSLLANASHELRSPLARMKMAVSMLEGAAPAQRDKLKLEINRNVAELDALVEEVLLASRLDGAQDPLHRDRVDLFAVAAEEASRVDAAIDAEGRMVIDGDERLLRRALRNLLENARRYGAGAIEARLSASPDGTCAQVRVNDRGPGVPAPLRERIFEPFYRLPGASERDGGVGLGLALVKSIVERHGGQVRCEDRPGGGASFVIELRK